MKRRANDADAPSPEQLAAYADGELDAVTRARVTAWLADHADAAAALEAQHRLDQAWQASTPPEPAEPEWAAVIERIVEGTQKRSAANNPLRAARPRVAAMLWRFGMLGTAAAAVLAAVLLLWPARAPVGPGGPGSVAGPVILKVADDADVEILSVDAADLDVLVVGTPPLRGPFVLAMPGDVILDGIVPDVDGMMPQVRMDTNNPDGPMIVVPLTVAINRP